MKKQLSLDPDGGERLLYNAPDFPVRCVQGDLSRFLNYAAGCHWHNDFEILLADSGDIEYFVNGKVVQIRQGQAIFVNANRLHYGFSSRKEECLYSVLVFHPDIFGFVALSTARSVQRMTSDAHPDYLLIKEGEIIDLFRQIQGIYAAPYPCHELDVLACCCRLVVQLQRKMETMDTDTSSNGVWLSLRQMVGYLQTNYRRAIRLEEIAAAGAVCRSKCCQLFREKMHATPIEYLNRYRMEKGKELLLATEYSITEIAHLCGFDSPSYFSKLFRETYGRSPRELKKAREE